jgi:serine/threonine protein kinase
MQQMFEGLFFIHNNKIIHRDMKAANILITRQVPLPTFTEKLPLSFFFVKECKNLEEKFRKVLNIYRILLSCTVPVLVYAEENAYSIHR